MPKKILVETNGPVTTITINRPEVRNALDKETALLLAAAFRAFEADDSQRVAVVTGAEGAFCAGADLKETAERADYIAWAGHPEGPFHNPLKKPLIGAVAGHACAGGLGLALFCDIRIAEESAVFGIFCRRWGVPMSDGTTVRLPRLIGRGPALDMMLTGRPVKAEEALTLGLVSRIVPNGTAREQAEELALQIASFPQIAMLSDRQSVYAQEGLTEAEAVKIEMALAEDAKQKEAKAGAARFAAGAGRHGEY
ncbi:MAG: crotonase/enoyl-CoA hydratase family protein [Alphaproteobacteria bacterium]|nr:MAG: crotonase/enoyl-CoA hydratase family protein [Alphaproteobacteria bacterium]